MARRSSHAPRPNPHRARGTAGVPPPSAISCLGAFRTPAAGARGEIIIPASEKGPAQGSEFRRFAIASSWPAPFG